jgi:hypothetical protein
MVFNWISGGVAAIFLAAAVLLFFSRRFQAVTRPVHRAIGGPMVLAIILLVVGLMSGGLAYTQGLLGTASISAPGSTAAQVSALGLASCDFNSGTGLAGNQTVRSDPNSNNRVFLDIAHDGSSDDKYDVNVTFDCIREGDVNQAGAVEIVAKGSEFRSETSTTDSALYNILATTSNPSSKWSGKFRQNVYLRSGGVASTSDTQEFVYLTFQEGEKIKTLGIFGTVDSTSFANLNNYTSKDITLYQRVGGSDSAVGYITINKIPSA